MIKKKTVKPGRQVKVTFVLPENHDALPASVVGDFNGWNPLAHPFRRRSNRTWSVAVQVEPGRRYRFRYLGDGGRWFDDEGADFMEDGPTGTRDCVVLA